MTDRFARINSGEKEKLCRAKRQRRGSGRHVLPAINAQVMENSHDFCRGWRGRCMDMHELAARQLDCVSVILAITLKLA